MVAAPFEAYRAMAAANTQTRTDPEQDGQLALEDVFDTPF
jgi:hypothetical protein